MTDAAIHSGNDTPTASDAGVKRSDADTNIGLGVSIGQGIGFTPTAVRAKDAIQNAPKTPS